MQGARQKRRRAAEEYDGGVDDAPQDVVLEDSEDAAEQLAGDGDGAQAGPGPGSTAASSAE
jgi:hypothetical protein